MISLDRRDFLDHVGGIGQCKLHNAFFRKELARTGKVPKEDYDFLIARNEWLEKEYGITQVTSGRFYFISEAHATWFSLKWSGNTEWVDH